MVDYRRIEWDMNPMRMVLGKGIVLTVLTSMKEDIQQFSRFSHS